MTYQIEGLKFGHDSTEDQLMLIDRAKVWKHGCANAVIEIGMSVNVEAMAV